jgi:hypothetical protein
MAIRTSIRLEMVRWIEQFTQGNGAAVGHNLASRTGDQGRNWDGEVYASHNLGFLARFASLRSWAG